MAYCPNCGLQAVQGDKFCLECGGQMPDPAERDGGKSAVSQPAPGDHEPAVEHGHPGRRFGRSALAVGVIAVLALALVGGYAAYRVGRTSGYSAGRASGKKAAEEAGAEASRAKYAEGFEAGRASETLPTNFIEYGDGFTAKPTPKGQWYMVQFKANTGQRGNFAPLVVSAISQKPIKEGALPGFYSWTWDW